MLALARLQIRDGVSRDRADDFLKLIRSVAGDDNMLPSSVKRLQTMTSVPSYRDFQVWYCRDCCHLIPIPEGSSIQSETSVCPTCYQSNPGATPACGENGWAFYLGVGNAIQALFMDDEFRRRRGESRTFSHPSTLWGCQEWKRIDSILKEMYLTDDEGNEVRHVGLFHPSASPYSVFIDSYLPTDSGNSSVCVVFLRCEDLDIQARSERRNCLPLMLIPDKPKDLHCFMQLVANDFRRLLANPLHANNSNFSDVDLVQRPVLVGMDADFPAGQTALRHVRGNTSYSSCPHCKGTAKLISEGGRPTIRFGGFAAEVKVWEKTANGDRHSN